MERLKKSRMPIRRQITMMVNEVTALIGADPVDKTTVRVKTQVLDTLITNLDEFDQKVIDQMVDDNVSVADQDTEYEAIRHYKESYLTLKLKLEDIILERASSPDSSQYESASTLGGTKQRKYKLPKVELRSFNGDLKQWLGWWSQFEKIHVDDDLHETDKFQYLAQCMEKGSDARELVDSYPQTAGNYSKAVDALKERCGRKDFLVQVYVRELLTLVISNVTNNEKMPLSQLYVRLESHLRSLTELELDKADPETWLFPLVESSLSEEHLRAWQRSNQSRIDGSKLNPPQTRLNLLMEFIKSEVQNEQQISLAQSGFKSNDQQQQLSNGKNRKLKKNEEGLATATGLLAAQSKSCVFCKGGHESDRCVKAQSLSMEDRKAAIKEANACFQCMKVGHGARKCKAVVKCVVCSGRHYPIMCSRICTSASDGSKVDVEKAEQIQQRKDDATIGAPPNAASIFQTSTSSQCSADVLLDTFRVQVIGSNGTTITIRAVGDTGSQRSYIKSNIAQQMKLKKVGEELIANVLFGGGLSGPTRTNRYNVPLKSVRSEDNSSFELLEKNIICGNIPCVQKGPWVQELASRGIWITDMDSCTEDVDILIGSDYWGQIMTGRVEKLAGGLIAKETIFGWTLSGKLPARTTTMANTVCSLFTTTQDLPNLWKLETIGIRDPIEAKTEKEMETEALDYFEKTVTRDDCGRYVVSLPWKRNHEDLQHNKEVAFKRLQRATSKLQSENKITAYNEIFALWKNEGFIKIINEDNPVGHYLPHRPVFQNSATTPVRPVFDASCKIGKNNSLNEYLYKGPNLLDLVPSLLLRFREKRIGMSADIKKAFQMLSVAEEDQPFQKFLWWLDTEKKTLAVYQHQRVVFGMTCSPFLLGATIKHHLENFNGYEETVQNMKRSFYVDNLIRSVDTIVEYEKFKCEATEIMKDAGMELREWASTIVAGSRLDQSNSQCHDTVMSILGMRWNRLADTLACEIKIPDTSTVTKRGILSAVAQVYDPIGILSPALIIPKLLLQETWMTKIGWDEELPEITRKKFLSWTNGMGALQEVAILRQFQINDYKNREVHTFCDASQSAMAAVIFMRTELNGAVMVQLICAKSRLSPISSSLTKSASIPRLELTACLIGSRLVSQVKNALELDDETPFWYWTDSSTALTWIMRNGNWAVYVENRVREIRLVTKENQWHHVSGVRNPADLPSRGCSPRALLESKWWEGPKWLYDDQLQWPASSPEVDENEVCKEERKTCLLASLADVKPAFSSYRKNVAVFGWIQRFLDVKLRGIKFDTKFLSIPEMRRAEKIMIRKIQQDCFPEGCTSVGRLQVFMDKENILRVRTRLGNRKDVFDFCYPILLPKKHPLVDLLVKDIHLFHGHGGIQFLLSKIREKYWITQARQAVKRIIHRCVQCRRFSAKPMEVEPADLPAKRVNDSEPYETTGVDLAGPLYLKDGRKAWIVLFTCAVYRCLHLDLVTSLSTEAFLQSLERFISIYGRPNTIYSDNGTNFVGSVSLFKKINWEKVSSESNVKQIQWIFNPPTGAWWGGWYERLVRSVKDLLKRMLMKAKLEYDDLRTCIAGVGATINDRPLTAISEDDDLIPLTPRMFLHFKGIGIMPETVTPNTLRQSYRKMKIIQQQLQTRFRKEYLSQLVMCGKRKRNLTLKVGDIVLVGADNRKRFDWPLGKIEELIPGKDKNIRVAKVRTTHGILLRPVQRLYPLEFQEDVSGLSEAAKEKVVCEDTPTEESTAVVTKSGRKSRPPSRYNQWLCLIKK